ncbi:hypothetical protein AAVH_18933 [Aphelenchoides avenae]|nr:hypothetical protein AAVH_18933 [Aphelenchus avenae]
MEPSTYISGKRNIVEVLEIALRNSIIGHLHVHCSSYYRPSTAAYLLMPTNATLVVENLHLCVQDFNGSTDLIDLFGRIRMIKVIELYGHDNGMNFEPVVNYCRERGVESVVFEGRMLL